MSLLLTGAGPVSAWSPAAILATLGSTFLPGLSRSKNLLWTDLAKTTNAVNDGDLIRVQTCPFTLTDWIINADAGRPTLKLDANGKWYADGLAVAAMRGPTQTTLNGNSTISARVLATIDEATQRFVQGDAVNALIAYRRASNCIYVNGAVHSAALGADANPHTITIAKPTAGSWSLWLDTVSQSVDGAVTNEFGRVNLGGVGVSAESYTGRIYGIIVDLSNANRINIENYLGSTG
jgi:hypothetical protein